MICDTNCERAAGYCDLHCFYNILGRAGMRDADNYILFGQMGRGDCLHVVIAVRNGPAAGPQEFMMGIHGDRSGIAKPKNNDLLRADDFPGSLCKGIRRKHSLGSLQ